MIYDSYEWKKELSKQSRKLQFISRFYWTDTILKLLGHKVDMIILTVAIIARKLFESGKLSDDADNYKICVKEYIPRRHIDRLHSWVEDGDYSWGEYQEKSIPAKYICNSIIHSYVYSLCFTEKRKLYSIFVVSDQFRNELLYEVTIADLTKYLKFIATDSVSEVSMKFDTKKGDHKTDLKRRS